MPQPAANWEDTYLVLVQDCEVDRRSKYLTDWETEFLASIRTQLENSRTLSIKQIETLEGVWEKATKNG